MFMVYRVSQILLLILLASLQLEAMENPMTELQRKPTQTEQLQKLHDLENNSDACVLKHLIEKDCDDKQSFKKTFANIRNYFLINKCVRVVASDMNILNYLLPQLMHKCQVNAYRVAVELATPSARVYLKAQNKYYPEVYTKTFIDGAIYPKAAHFLKGFIACDETGLAFQGVPRITLLMIAVGYKNIEAVDILIDAARKRGILNTYINMQCPQGTSTHNEWFSTDNEYNFFCFEGYTALHIASTNANKVPLSIVEKLLLNGADPNAKNTLSPPPLYAAVVANKDKDFSRAKLLLDYNADCDCVINNPKSKLTAEEISFLKSYKIKIR